MTRGFQCPVSIFEAIRGAANIPRSPQPASFAAPLFSRGSGGFLTAVAVLEPSPHRKQAVGHRGTREKAPAGAKGCLLIRPAGTEGTPLSRRATGSSVSAYLH